MNQITFPTRININLSLDQELEAYVRNLNAKIAKLGFREILFDEPAMHIPHITLLMGDVASNQHMVKIKNACRYFASTRTPQAFTVSSPYWNSPTGNYIFLATLPDDLFRCFRYSLQDLMSGLIEYDEYGGPENTSHITVAYAKHDTLTLEDFASKHYTNTCSSGSIRICTTGERGTCTKLIWSAKFSSQEGGGEYQT